MLAAMMRMTALFCMLAAARSSTLSLVPSTQTGFFKRGSDVGPMNPHSYRPNEFGIYVHAYVYMYTYMYICMYISYIL